MGAHMKTTIEIGETLLAEAKARAQEQGTTLRALVERGLRAVLDEEIQADQPFRIEPFGDPRRTWTAEEQRDVEQALRDARAGRSFPELDLPAPGAGR